MFMGSTYASQKIISSIWNNAVLYFTDKPHNPMVNAGAIVVTSLIKVKCWISF